MHRTSPKTRSLSLQRETVRVLASADLTSVQGGATLARQAFSDDNRAICHIDISDLVGPLPAPGSAGHGGNGCQPTWTFTGTIVINPSIIGRP
jgi:hypothetical protein